MANWKKPQPGEVFPYQEKYIALVEGDDVPEMLSQHVQQTIDMLAGIDEQKALFRYAPGKWSVKEVLQHLIDTERIMCYRALRFARKDKTPLPGFEENDYAPASMADNRSMVSLLQEFAAVRHATIMLFESFTDDMIARTGTGNGKEISVNALGFIIVGHELHHMKLFKEKYLI
ncbi:MAG TPA: DinB family protein [Chitinophagales bacterium]|nr:DinB family protein [Chitinophagales bacterium]